MFIAIIPHQGCQGIFWGFQEIFRKWIASALAFPLYGSPTELEKKMEARLFLSERTFGTCPESPLVLGHMMDADLEIWAIMADVTRLMCGIGLSFHSASPWVKGRRASMVGFDIPKLFPVRWLFWKVTLRPSTVFISF